MVLERDGREDMGGGRERARKGVREVGRVGVRV